MESNRLGIDWGGERKSLVTCAILSFLSYSLVAVMKFDR